MKLLRYHNEVFIPDWYPKSITNFCLSLVNIKLSYSYHAKKRLSKLSRKQRSVVTKFIKVLRLDDEQIPFFTFEFYASNKNIVKKICLRIPFKENKFDLVLVISYTGKIVTLYLNDMNDGHKNLNKELYQKGE